MDNFSVSDLLGSLRGILLVVLFFGGSIFVHELGHFLAARKRGLKVERFSIGFGPRLFGWTGKDGVDYRVSLIPLGGYVALPQLADMQGIEGENSDDAEALPKISYADKMIVSVMGAVFNVIFAFVLATILWFTGMPVIMLGNRRDAQDRPTSVFTVERAGQTLEITVNPARLELNARSGDRIRVAGIQARAKVVLDEPMPDSPAAKAGLRKGDRVLAVDGQAVNNSAEFRELLRKGGAVEHQLKVERADGSTATLPVTPQISTRVNPVSVIAYGEEAHRHSLIVVPVTKDLLSRDPAAPRDQLMVLGVSPEDPALAEALRIGTIVDKVDGKEFTAIRSLEDLDRVGAGAPRELTLYWKRANGDSGNLALAQASVRRGKPVEVAQIGVTILSRPDIQKRNPFETCVDIVRSTFTTLRRLFDRDSDIKVNQLASVISITKTYYNISEDITRVLFFTVLINLNLAILNLLPIPVLDGGHMLIATIQRYTNNAIKASAVIILQYTFMALLFGLMAYIILNDVRRCSGDSEMQLRQQILERHVYKSVEYRK